MKRTMWVRWTGFVLLSLLSTLSVGGRASADSTLSLDLTGGYNTTTISFNYGTTAESVSGGGIVDGTLSGGSYTGVSLTYLYCLQWAQDVLVPNIYKDTVVDSDGQIHGGSLLQPDNVTPVSDPVTAAQNIAWLVVNEAPLAGNNATLQAGLQAAIWAQVTPNFTLTSTGDIATDFANDNTALANARIDPSQAGSFAYDESQVLFLSPSQNGEANQALIGYIPPSVGVDPFLATPEPATYAMALSGLVPLGLVALARRRRRATTSA